jgi:hypothetical protein
MHRQEKQMADETQPRASELLDQQAAENLPRLSKDKTRQEQRRDRQTVQVQIRNRSNRANRQKADIPMQDRQRENDDRKGKHPPRIERVRNPTQTHLTRPQEVSSGPQTCQTRRQITTECWRYHRKYTPSRDPATMETAWRPTEMSTEM